MIRYDLVCPKGHEFDSWFRDSGAFDSQNNEKMVRCPECGSSKIEKALMAPRLTVKSNARGAQDQTGRNSPALADTSPQDPGMAAFKQAVRELRNQVTASSDYVGDRFAEEARRIYYAESEERGIYGEATLEDAKSLHEEGIDVLPLPLLPEDRN